MTQRIRCEIASLRQMTIGELRCKYQQVFGEPTRAGNKDFLAKRIAWRLQSAAEGSLSERARRRAAELARDGDIRTTIPPAPRLSDGAESRTVAVPVLPAVDERVPPPGTVLTRLYRGQRYHVTVLPDGFEYDGQVYRSLSAIAKAITGSHWNGYLFFKIAQANLEATHA